MNSVANIRTITKRELAAYFTSPLAYVVIVIFLLLMGFFTFMAGGFFEIGQANLISQTGFRSVSQRRYSGIRLIEYSRIRQQLDE